LKPPKGVLMSPLSKQLTRTTPARSERARRWARVTSSVHTAAARPYVVSFGDRDRLLLVAKRDRREHRPEDLLRSSP